MYIDSSRLLDLRKIDSLLKDVSQPLYRKKRFAETRAKILRQLKDPKLAVLRERLVRATLAEDKYEAWKISCQIKDYMKEEKHEWEGGGK